MYWADVRRSLLDVRVYWGDESLKASDHHLVLARIKMKLKRVWLTRSTRPRYNVGFLKDREVLGKFHLSLCHRYQVPQNFWKMKAKTCRTNGNSQKRLGSTPVWIY